MLREYPLDKKMHSCFSKIFIYLSRNYNVWGNSSVKMLAALLIFQFYALGFGRTALTSSQSRTKGKVNS